MIRQKLALSPHKNILLLLLIAVLGGAVPVFGKIALTEFPVFSFTFFRFLMAGLLLLPFYLKIRKPTNGDFWKIFGLSLLGMGNVILFAIGIQYTSANIAQAIYTLSPILAAVLSFFIVKERFGLKKITGIILGFFGALILVFIPLLEKGSLNDVTLSGNLIIVLAVISVTLYTVYSKPLQKKYHPIEITMFFCMVTAGISLIFSGMELRTESGWWSDVTLFGAFSLIYVGTIGTALYYLLTQYLIKHATPTIASMVLYVQPFTTIGWAYVLLSEVITQFFIIGICLALFGVWLTMSPQKKLLLQE